MKVLVINLNKDRARWASVEAQLQHAGLDFQRIPAILGRDLTPQEREAHYSPLKSSWRQARELTPAEIGCALSHLTAYREISMRGFSHALILEDDVVLKDKLAELLDALASQMPPEDPLVCLLSPAEVDMAAEPVALVGRYVIQKYKSGYYASSYVLTRVAAEYLLGELHPVGDVADCWARLYCDGGLKLMAVTPPAVTQNQAVFGSSTTEDIRAAFGVSQAYKLIYRLRRVRNILLGRVLEHRWKRQAKVVGPRTSHPIDTLVGRH